MIFAHGFAREADGRRIARVAENEQLYVLIVAGFDHLVNIDCEIFVFLISMPRHSET